MSRPPGPISFRHGSRGLRPRGRILRTAPLLERGATWANSPRDVAAQCDVACVCVPGPPEMRAVTLGPGGTLEGVRPDAVVVDHTTNSPALVREVGAALAARGVHLLDAPLDGGREG